MSFGDHLTGLYQHPHVGVVAVQHSRHLPAMQLKIFGNTNATPVQPISDIMSVMDVERQHARPKQTCASSQQQAVLR